MTWPAIAPLSQIGRLPWTSASQPFEISCQLELIGELTHSPPPVVVIVGKPLACCRAYLLELVQYVCPRLFEKRSPLLSHLDRVGQR